MKIPMPSFGLISATATSSIFLPHALVLLGVIFFHHESWRDPTLLFLFFTITARLTGDWLFWSRLFPQEMDSGANIENWRSSVKDILTSQPPAIKSVLDMVIDAVVDITLIYMAFKASAPPMWILFTFSACQAVGAPIQGIIIRVFDRKNVRLFSMIVSALATCLALEINGVLSHEFYASLFEPFSFPKSIQMLIILGAKCLLTGTAVIAKET